MSESKLIRVEDLEKIYQDRIDMLLRDGDPDSVMLAGAVSGCLQIAKELVPAVEADPVIHAHWENPEPTPGGNPGDVACSHCGWTSPSVLCDRCSHCGAHMDEEV